MIFLYGLLNEIHTQQIDKRKCYCLQYVERKEEEEEEKTKV